MAFTSLGVVALLIWRGRLIDGNNHPSGSAFLFFRVLLYCKYLNRKGPELIFFYHFLHLSPGFMLGTFYLMCLTQHLICSIGTWMPMFFQAIRMEALLLHQGEKTLDSKGKELL